MLLTSVSANDVSSDNTEIEDHATRKVVCSSAGTSGAPQAKSSVYQLDAWYTTNGVWPGVGFWPHTSKCK